MLFTQLRPPLLIAIPFSLVKKNLQATFFVDKKVLFFVGCATGVSIYWQVFPNKRKS